MTLVKRNSNQFPIYPRLFDDSFTKDLTNWRFNNLSPVYDSIPKVNIVEQNDTFKVEMAAPGMDKKDFQIQLDNGVLKISVEKEIENEVNEDTRLVKREYNYQSFQRTFYIPNKVVDTSKIVAEYKGGILKILIPKKEEAKALAPRNIEIK